MIRCGGINPIVILTLDSKRRPTVPGLAPAELGDHFEAEFNPEEDAIVFCRIAMGADWLGVVKRCPVKMDNLPPCRREYPKRLKM